MSSSKAGARDASLKLRQHEFARAAQLETLEAVLNSEAPLAFVVGEAGAGKSHLLDHLAARLDYAMVTIEIESSFGVPFEALDRALRALARRNGVHLEATPAPQVRDRAELFSHYAARFAAHRGGNVRALAFDNAHWLDRGTLDFFEYLLAGQRRPFPLIVTTRPAVDAEPAQRDFVTQMERDARTVWLRPLDDASIGRLIEKCADPAIVRRIVELSGGNPHTALELLAATESLESGGAWQPIPQTLSDAVRRRYERLEPVGRRAMDFAAAMGRSFDPGLLAAAMRTEPLEIAAHLRRGVELELLQREDGDGKIAFKHELTRDAIYHNLLAFEARELHAKIAANIEIAAPAGFARDMLAHEQWCRAGRFEEAQRTGEAAALHASYAFANEDVIAIFQRLSALAPSAEQRARFAERIAAAHVRDGRYELAREVLAASLADCAFSSDLELRAGLAHRMAVVLYNSHDFVESEATLDAIPGILGESSASTWMFRMHVSKALSAVQRGDVDGARARLEQAAALPGTETEFRARANDSLRLRIEGEVCAASGDRAGWLRASDLALARALDDAGAVRVVNVRITRAMSAIAFGEFDIALDALNVAIEEAHVGRFHSYAAIGYAYRSRVHLDRGEFSASNADRRRALEIPEAGEIARDAATVSRLLCAAYSGDLADCSAALDFAGIERWSKLPNPSEFASFALAHIEAFIALDRLDEARALLERAVTPLRSAHNCGQLLALTVEFADAILVSKAEQLFAERALTPRDRAFSELFAARTAFAARRIREARRHASEAALQFERIGMPVPRTLALDLAGLHDEASALAESIGFRAFIERRERVARVKNRRGRELAALTRRERDVALQLSKDLSNREIAERLGIGERTVETHVAMILHKSGARTRHEALEYFRRQSGTGL